MLRTKKEVNVVKNTECLSVFEYFVKKDNVGLGFAVASLDGKYGSCRNKKVDQIIYVLEGKIKVDVDGKSYALEKEDALFLKKGNWYSVNGKAKFVVVTSPAWFYEQYETK